MPAPAPPPTHARAARGYLLAQAAAVAAWWAWLWLAPDARAHFLAPGWPDATLTAFALPDLLVLAPASALGGAGRVTAAWCAFAAAAYATLFCLGASFATGGGWLSTGLMVACTLGSLWAAPRVGGTR